MSGQPDLGATCHAVNWVFTTIALITVLLRLRIRFKERHNAGWDDYIIALSALVDIAAAIMFSVAVATGTGKHLADIPPQDLPKAGKMNLIATALVIMDIVIPKLSIAILLVRLLSPKRAITATMITLALIGIALGISLVAITFLQCSPVAGQWNPEKYHPKCWDPKVIIDYSFAGGAWATFLDFTFAIYPVRVFWTLQMSLSKKVGVCMLMSLGIVAGAVSIKKNIEIPDLGNKKDITYVSAKLLLWSIIEANCVILAASIPTLKPYTRTIKSLGTHLRSNFGHEKARNYTKFSANAEGGDRVELVSQKSSNGSHPEESSDWAITRKTEFSVEADKSSRPLSDRNDPYRQYGLTDI